jgi:hypothetical protein
MEHSFPQQAREFFRVEPLDDQAPVIVSQYPADGFAVGRFADLSILLDDVSGIDPASIRLTVGASGEMQQGDAGLTISGNTITTVNPASVVITYTDVTAPAFAAGTYLANRTPANVNDIFYRKITSVVDNAAAKTLTLGTVDVPFAEIVPDGSIEVNDQTIAYDLDAAGNIQRAVSFDKTFTSDPVGFNLDGFGPVPLSGSPAFTLNLPEAHLTATPTLRLAFETKWGSLQEASVDSRLVVDAA